MTAEPAGYDFAALRGRRIRAEQLGSRLWPGSARAMESVRIPLKAVDLYRRFAPAEEPRTYNLDDGRTVLAIPQDDGSVRQLVLDAEGNSSLLPAHQRADWFDDQGRDPASPSRR